MSPKNEKRLNIYIAIISSLSTIILTIVGYFSYTTLQNVENLRLDSVRHDTKIENLETDIREIKDNNSEQDKEIVKLKTKVWNKASETN